MITYTLKNDETLLVCSPTSRQVDYAAGTAFNKVGEVSGGKLFMPADTEGVLLFIAEDSITDKFDWGVSKEDGNDTE